jgi:NADPH:quinone reductase-like Zn-dependent oxidoreductase
LRNFAILGKTAAAALSAANATDTVLINDIPVTCGIVETDEPEFDCDAPENRLKVLIQVKAFSLNYRDKNRIFSMTVNGAENGFYVVGSEFLAEVLAVGPEVRELRPGDRVIGNNSYPVTDCDGVAPGVPTNHASREIQVLHQAKLFKAPDSMPDPVAASFSIGAQTTYSMIRRLDIPEGANVLVTAAKSNTSLFAIHALKSRKVNLYATSTSDRFESELKRAGVKQLTVITSGGGSFAEVPDLAYVARSHGGFHSVIDPYFDLHLSRVLDVMAIGGKYTTCGLYDQYLNMIQKQPPQVQRSGRELVTIMLHNLSIIGNCIGLTSDLQRAACDFARGLLEVTVDSVYSGNQIAEFLDRTYNAEDRFGKVVFQYV